MTDVADLLAAAVPSLFATADPRLVDVALELQDHRGLDSRGDQGVAADGASDALDIPVNRLPGMTERPAKLLFFRDTGAVVQGRWMKFTIVGPDARRS